MDTRSSASWYEVRASYSIPSFWNFYGRCFGLLKLNFIILNFTSTAEVMVAHFYRGATTTTAAS